MFSWLHGERGRQLGGRLLLIPLLAAALWGGNVLGVRDHFFPLTSRLAGPALNRFAGEPIAQQAAITSEPWWQSVATLTEVTPTATFSIGAQALQWRVSWSCQQGHLTVHPSAPSSPSLVDSACPGAGVKYEVATGRQMITVVDSGPWKLKVEQEVDAPLEQPSLAAMTAPGARIAMSGLLYGIDQQGQGRVAIYRLADGTYALRLSNFYVTPNSDLEIRLSPLRAPHTTGDYTSNPSVHVAALPITAGSMNFAMPTGLNPTLYGSVVIWCQRLLSAYAGASLSTG